MINGFLKLLVADEEDWDEDDEVVLDEDELVED